MSTAQLATATTIVAEIAMALHPILIKQVGVNLPTQLLVRLEHTVFSAPPSQVRRTVLFPGGHGQRPSRVPYSVL